MMFTMFVMISQHRPPTRQSASKVCRVCSDQIGHGENGKLFVACHVCSFPVCQPCYEFERSEGNQCCPQCNTRYKRHKGYLNLWSLVFYF